MEFYFREEPLQVLAHLEKQSHTIGKMAVLLGRRRVGKTSLALEFIKDKPALYLFVAKKSEALLCESFVEEIKHTLHIPIHGKIESVKAIFSMLLDYSKTHPLTVVMDEFQEFFTINPSVYSDIQGLWDRHKKDAHLNLIFIGSVYSLMNKIFENEKEPLFGRADSIIQLRPFSISEMQHILEDHNIFGLERLFEFYVTTGCVPKHLDILLTNGCKNLDDILNFMVKENSIFLDEGRNQLIEEFGKEYIHYFSILELIARGKTMSSDIQSIIQKNVSAYLDKLENVYHVIKKFNPINAKPHSKLAKYQINDNFLQFWFRFFHKNRDAIEIGNYPFIKEVIKRNFSTYSGKILEKFFFELLAKTQHFNRLGTYWEKGNKNEIDIVGVNDLDKKIVVAEVKTNSRRNSETRLQHRSMGLLKTYTDYSFEYLTLSLKDAEKYL